MTLHSILGSKLFFHVVIGSAMLIGSVWSLDSKYEACLPQNCGSGPNITYPFWILDNDTDFCGYPGFEVACEQRKPIYRTSRSHYLIKDIFYQNQSFRLVNVEDLKDDRSFDLI